MLLCSTILGCHLSHTLINYNLHTVATHEGRKIAMSILAFSLVLSFLFYDTECTRAGKLVLIENPGEAVCLDGSPPGYYFRPGLVFM